MTAESPNPPHAGSKSRDREVVIDIECCPSANGTISKPSKFDDNAVRKGFSCNATYINACKDNRKIYPFNDCLDTVVMPVANGGLQGALSSMARDDADLHDKDTPFDSKKKKSKKHAKPPRPPKGLSIDAADQKLVQEITELALLKRARIQRMKALKKMKNAKTSSSNSNLWAFIITGLFCFIIIWQGFFSSGNSLITYEGSPSSSVANKDGLFSIQYYKSVSKKDPEDSSSVSPNIANWSSGTDIAGELSRAAT